MNYEHAGRIGQDAVLRSVTALLILVLLAVVSRTFIRVGVQKTFQLDDGCIAFGTLLLIVAVAMLYHYADDMFMVEAYLTGDLEVVFDPEFFNRALSFHKWAAVSLTILWSTITAVKFGFLFLFLRLIDRLRPWRMYWWVVCGYTAAVYLFGICAYFVPFRHFYDVAELETTIGGDQYHYTLVFAISQLVLDIFGDLLILVIPVKLIWQIRILYSQKLALACSLCLSVLLIAVTITRASGLVMHTNSGNTVDVVWEVYWQFVSAEIGLVLTSATAFRALFVSRGSGVPAYGQHQAESWVKAIIRRLSIAVTLFRGTRKAEGLSTPVSNTDTARLHQQAVPPDGDIELPRVPRPLMTGMRSFIHREGRDSISPPVPLRAEIMVCRTIEVTYSDSWPLTDANGVVCNVHRAELP